MTLKDLKAGYLVEQRNGNLKMVMPYDDGSLCIIDSHQFFRTLDYYTEDLLSKTTIDFDIIKVYGYSKNAWESMLLSKQNRPLLWEREEQKEMTVAEIEAELGYKIKIVG